MRTDEIHYKMTETADGFMNVYLDLSPRPDSNTIIISYTEEEIAPYFAGDRDAVTTADVLQKRVSIYLAE